MKPRDPKAAVVSLLLIGSVLFLVSGLVARFLRIEHEVRDFAAGRVIAGGPASAELPASPADPPIDGGMAAQRASESVESPPELLIEGRILDPNAQPVEDATVNLELRLDSRPTEVTAGPPRSVRTAADGRFAFLGDAPRRPDVWITLVARAVGRAPQLSQHAVESGASLLEVGDIELQAGGSVAGRITDAGGRPLSRATASLQPAAGHPLQFWSDRSDFLPPASADAAGFYEFQNLMPGAYRVTATAPGMQEGSLRDAALVEEGRDIEVGPIRLVPGLELAGSVLAPNDAPVPGAQVHVRSLANGSRFDQRIPSGADGRFAIEHAPAGLLQIEASAAGFATSPRVEVDTADAREIVLRLAPGQSVRGVVVDASSGAPIERFAAAIRAIGRPELSASGAATRVLRRRIQALRDANPAAGDPVARARSERAALELEGRLQAIAGNPAPVPPRRSSPEGAPLADHPNGTFEFTGLDDGIYAVDVTPLEHAFASIAPIEVRRDATTPALRVAVAAGYSVSGVVVAKEGGAALADAVVDLVAVEEFTSEPAGGAREAGGSPFPWAFASSRLHGIAVLSAKSDAQGRFALRHAPPGHYFLSATHDTACRERTGSFDLHGDRDDLEIVLAATAILHGRVRGIPAGAERDVAVLAIGGFGTQRTVKVAADGTYRIERMQPGGYVVRALASDTDDAIGRQVSAIFENEAAPTPPDVTLAAGERGEHDLTLDLPAVGIVEGSILINGQPAPGFQVVLRSARVSLRSLPDNRGRFALRSVPPGDYTLQVFSTSGRQEVHREPITVAAGASTRIDAMVTVGGLRGRVVANDASATERLDGTLTILPGASVAPADVRQYGQTHRVHTVRVRDGAFQVDHLTPGAALVIVELRGRHPIETSIDIPARSTIEAEFPAGRIQ